MSSDFNYNFGFVIEETVDTLYSDSAFNGRIYTRDGLSKPNFY